jgi:hypothetical protein
VTATSSPRSENSIAADLRRLTLIKIEGKFVFPDQRLSAFICGDMV